ncbi:MAG: hypothetical protein DRI56_13335 [Chloroflexota bacterium]|nr:MAG: hypothetical protein DRI56_13335 [Chloroflexota bacterium]
MNNERNFDAKYLFLFIFLAILIFWMIVFREQISNLHRLSDEVERAKATESALVTTQQYLSTQAVLAQSGEFAEEWARKNEKWIQEGDHRIVIIPAEGTPIAFTPTPKPTAKPPNNFQIWWELFFTQR